MESARGFINERLTKNDSAIFAASEDNIMCGFVQLYPSFSSVAMKRTYYLNDLFVNVSFRRNGIAKALIEKSIKFAMENDAAKNLYIKSGFTKNTSYDYFNFTI
jgi:ribosomal protein S18 acetylase RimI-like enzyme